MSAKLLSVTVLEPTRVSVLTIEGSLVADLRTLGDQQSWVWVLTNKPVGLTVVRAIEAALRRDERT